MHHGGYLDAISGWKIIQLFVWKLNEHLSQILMLLECSDQLRGPLDSLWTGGKFLLNGLDLVGVNHLFS